MKTSEAQIQSVVSSPYETERRHMDNDTRIGLMGREAATNSHWVETVRDNIAAAGLSDAWTVDTDGVHRIDDTRKDTE